MSKTVEFVADIYPYCVGDVVVLDDNELARVDKEAKKRKVKEAYVSFGASQPTPAASGSEDDGQDGTDEPSINDLRARAKELEISASGSKDDLKARIAEKEESLKDASNQDNGEGGDTSEGDQE